MFVPLLFMADHLPRQFPIRGGHLFFGPMDENAFPRGANLSGKDGHWNNWGKTYLVHAVSSFAVK